MQKVSTNMKFLLCLPFTCILLAPALAAAEESTTSLFDPTIILIRDEAMRNELELTDAQRTGVDELLRKHNRVLLAIRDVGPAGADETAQPVLEEIREALAELLTREQMLRLQGLILQAQGYDALLRKDIVAALELNDVQQTRLAEIAGAFREKAQALQRSGGGQVGDELAKLQADRHKEIVALLDQKQEQQFGKLLGAPFDFGQVIKSPAWAPEFEGIDQWINSEPLTMKELRGKVVVVHFFAFHCSNCINNYPWYREWQDAFQGEDVVLIGIHTPETEAERDNAALRASLEQHELEFPVAVDKNKTMWSAWYNRIWPSVYLIDRAGRLRYWWYGELNWQGAGNQNVARRQIEKLLPSHP